MNVEGEIRVNLNVMKLDCGDNILFTFKADI